MRSEGSRPSTHMPEAELRLIFWALNSAETVPPTRHDLPSVATQIARPSAEKEIKFR